VCGEKLFVTAACGPKFRHASSDSSRRYETYPKRLAEDARLWTRSAERARLSRLRRNVVSMRTSPGPGSMAGRTPRFWLRIAHPLHACTWCPVRGGMTQPKRARSEPWSGFAPAATWVVPPRRRVVVLTVLIPDHRRRGEVGLEDRSGCFDQVHEVGCGCAGEVDRTHGFEPLSPVADESRIVVPTVALDALGAARGLESPLNDLLPVASRLLAARIEPRQELSEFRSIDCQTSPEGIDTYTRVHSIGQLPCLGARLHGLRKPVVHAETKLTTSHFFPPSDLGDETPLFITFDPGPSLDDGQATTGGDGGGRLPIALDELIGDLTGDNARDELVPDAV